MEIKINSTLVKLSNIFISYNIKLYIVGGFLRDSLLGNPSSDIDICSSATNEQLEVLLKDTPFNFKVASKKLGTSIISYKNKKFEHTTLRREFYKKGGEHSPQKVKFTDNIKADAKRRDFTINSLYYDIEGKQLLDPFKGLKDLQIKQIKTTLSPRRVFSQDGLRILRLVRFAKRLDFKINKKTFNVAKKMSYQLKDISLDRIFAEFKLLLKEGSNSYENKIFTTKKLAQLNAFKYIFKNLYSKDKSFKKHLQQLHYNLEYYKNSPKDVVFYAFLLDFCLFFAKILQKYPSLVAKELFVQNNYGISNIEAQTFFEVVKAYEKSLNLQNDIEVRHFLQEYNKEYVLLLKLLKNSTKKQLYKIIKSNCDYMIKYNIPFTLQQLNLDGNILQKNFPKLKGEQVGKLLRAALMFCAKDKNNNNTQTLLEYLKSEVN